ncbi:MAG: FkbM family methyltransferase [Methyloligellaceae bacterium]
MTIKIFNSLIKKTKSYRKLEDRVSMLENFICSQEHHCLIQLKNDGCMYLPYMFTDAIQKHLFTERNFYEIEILIDLDQYFQDINVIFDVGANIGNHSVYWALKHNLKAIHAFEPLTDTYNILRKNIDHNHISHVVSCHNIGIGKTPSKASVDKTNRTNIGATSLKADQNGNITINSIDSFLGENSDVDFIKIDVEGFELDVLMGSMQTLRRCKPIIFIETFEDNKEEVCAILGSAGYRLEKEYENDNFLFIHR